MDDARAWSPEANVVLGARGRQEVVDLFVDILSTSEVLFAADLSLDQMVTVDGGWRCHRRHAGRHELEDGHLCGGILTRHTVGTKLQVRLATLDVLAVRIIEMRVQDLELSADCPRAFDLSLTFSANVSGRLSRARTTERFSDIFLHDSEMPRQSERSVRSRQK